jgi:16S rRNA (adenine1518-N6/adenine1519-N6)-dimethyltransferase
VNRTRHPHRHRAPSTEHRAPRKRFGQHFLEPAWVDKLIRAIGPQPADTFVEIGPGRGALTRPLAERVRRAVAYEIDRDLAAELRASAPANVVVVEGDFLDQPPPTDRLATDGLATFRVAANLPYNVAAPIIFRLIDWSRQHVPISDATLMVQREVADRLAARPGTKDYGVLTILVGHRATVTRLLDLPPGAFRPPPKVHSTVVRLQFHAPAPAVRDETAFARLVQSVFTRRRKTLANALKALKAPGLPDAAASSRVVDAAGIDLSRRPETLTIAEFARLADLLVA